MLHEISGSDLTLPTALGQGQENTNKHSSEVAATANPLTYSLPCCLPHSADSLSENGAGSTILSDASGQLNMAAYASEPMMEPSQIPSMDPGLQGHLYQPQPLMGHYQQIAGVRHVEGHCHWGGRTCGVAEIVGP